MLANASLVWQAKLKAIKEKASMSKNGVSEEGSMALMPSTVLIMLYKCKAGAQNGEVLVNLSIA